MHAFRKAWVFLYLSTFSFFSLLRHISTHVVQRAISADGASLVQIVHLAHYRSNAARAETRSAAPDELSERAEELALREGSLEREEMGEYADDHQELLCRVALHEREERGVKHIRAFDLVCVLSEEEHTLVDQLADNEAQDLAQITTRDQFLFFFLCKKKVTRVRRRLQVPVGRGNAYLECLLAGFIRSFVYHLIVLCPREMFVLERIESALFGYRQLE